MLPFKFHYGSILKSILLSAATILLRVFVSSMNLPMQTCCVIVMQATVVGTSLYEQRPIR